MQILYPGFAVFAVAMYLVLQSKLVPRLDVAVLAAAMLASLLIAIFSKKEWYRNIFCIGFFVLLGLVNGLRLGPSAAEQLQPYYGKEVLLSGSIEALSGKEGEQYFSYILQSEKLQQGEQTINYQGRVRLTLPQKAKGSIIVAGRLKPLLGLRNPGCFDGELFNRINNIGGRLTQARLLPSSDKQENTLFQQLQERLSEWNVALREALNARLVQQLGTLLGNMLLGGSSSLDDETRDVFVANGLAHLLSVSGTHLVLLAGLCSSLLRAVPSLWRKALLTIALGIYALLCGLRPPVLRALLMSVVLLWGRQAEVKEPEKKSIKQSQHYPNPRAERGYLLCLVALVLLLVKPLWLLDLGFQPSFGAAAGLIWLVPACTRLLLAFMPAFLAEPLAVTMAAQLATLPTCLASFHQLSLISCFSNLVLVPVLELAVLLAALGILVAQLPLSLLASLGSVLLQCSSFLLTQLLEQAHFLASLPFSQLVIGSLPLWCAVLYYALILLWADVSTLQFWSNRERRWLMTTAAVVLAGAFLWQRYAPQPLQAYFLDVGQGDCVVLRANSMAKQKVIVYDTGGLPHYDTGKQVVAPFLRSLGQSSIDALILSHYDFDHVGGAIGLMEQIQVRELVLPKEKLDASSLLLYEAITKTAARRGTHISVAQQGRTWQMGEGAVLSLVVPADLANKTGPENLLQPAVEVDAEKSLAGNEASTILTLHSPHGSLLLTGDLGSEGEQGLELGHFTVFKAGHHGSKYSNSEELLRHIQPQLSIISCGFNNRYGHPHKETIERLQAVGSQIFRTDLQGCIQLRFDESGIKCYSYTYEDNYAEVHSWK